MARQTVEQRLAALEVEVARLKKCVEKSRVPDTDWLDVIWGSFANDPAYEEAMRLGREWRKSFRPKSRARGKR